MFTFALFSTDKECGCTTNAINIARRLLALGYSVAVVEPESNKRPALEALATPAPVQTKGKKTTTPTLTRDPDDPIMFNGMMLCPQWTADVPEADFVIYDYGQDYKGFDKDADVYMVCANAEPSGIEVVNALTARSDYEQRIYRKIYVLLQKKVSDRQRKVFINIVHRTFSISHNTLSCPKELQAVVDAILQEHKFNTLPSETYVDDWQIEQGQTNKIVKEQPEVIDHIGPQLDEFGMPIPGTVGTGKERGSKKEENSEGSGSSSGGLFGAFGSLFGGKRKKTAADSLKDLANAQKELDDAARDDFDAAASNLGLDDGDYKLHGGKTKKGKGGDDDEDDEEEKERKRIEKEEREREEREEKERLKAEEEERKREEKEERERQRQEKLERDKEEREERERERREKAEREKEEREERERQKREQAEKDKEERERKRQEAEEKRREENERKEAERKEREAKAKEEAERKRLEKEEADRKKAEEAEARKLAGEDTKEKPDSKGGGFSLGSLFNGLVNGVGTVKDAAAVFMPKPKQKGTEVATIKTPSAKAAMLGHVSIFVTSLDHSAGNTIVAGSIALAFAKQGIRSCLCHTQGTQTPNHSLISEHISQDFGDAYVAGKVVIYDRGVAAELSEVEKRELNRCDIKILVCKHDEKSLGMLAKFISANPNKASDYLYVFNLVIDKNTEKEIRKLMEEYNIMFVPPFSFESMSKELADTWITVLKKQTAYLEKKYKKKK